MVSHTVALKSQQVEVPLDLENDATIAVFLQVVTIQPNILSSTG